MSRAAQSFLFFSGCILVVSSVAVFYTGSKYPNAAIFALLLAIALILMAIYMEGLDNG